MKYSIIKLILLLVICLSGTSYAQLLSTYSLNTSTMQEIEEWCDSTDSIVFINTDGVLTTPKSKMFSYGNNPYRYFIDNLFSLGRESPEYKSMVVKWYQHHSIILIEEQWKYFIQNLQTKGVKVYGIYTEMMPLLNIEKKVYYDIKNLGIKFSQTINDQNALIIERNYNWNAMFYKGIITTGPYSKANTIASVIKYIKPLPKKLVFIDNIKHNLRQSEKVLKKFDIQYYNILYLGYMSINQSPDPEVVQLQQRELMINGKWLEDDAAQERLKQYHK